MIDRDFPVILVAPSGKAGADVPKLLDLFEERGARVAAISDQISVLSRAEVRLPMPAGVPEWLSPLAAIAPGQLWAFALARARGRDPDRPRGLSKVTLTR